MTALTERALDGARVLVTGGAGFVGSWLCERLLDEGAAVWCVDSFLTGSPDKVAHLRDRPDFTLVEADVSDGVPDPGGLDVVMHLACPASPVHYLRRPLETLRVGSVGTAHCLDLAERHGARFVLASTSEVYGDPLEHPQRESYWGHVNPIGPRSVYDEGKRFAEATTAAYRRERGVDTGIARIFNTFGPRMSLDDGRVVPAFVHQALLGEPLTVAGDGSQTRSLCWVEDTVDGLVRLACADEPGPVNLGNDTETTVLELARTIIGLVGSSSTIEFVPLPEDDPKVRQPDISRARERLGWRPLTDVDEGLKQTVRWMHELVGPDGAAPRAQP
ncbi:UDP-glucuronic acid decarboxylase family protein [Nocardioides sp. DS6]|uniref:UDP-glucuronate decarboxylase n=1 Tax=Nocardioides eburneus TaxID=3231482 RepID=A0ABV3SZ73_9ACTN